MIRGRIESGADLARILDSLSTRLSRGLVRDTLLEAGEPIRRRASELCARAPGAPDLADNINIASVHSRSAGDQAAVGIGVPRAFYYDTMLEFGTVHMAAQPFYRPAFDEGGQKAIGAISQILWRELAGRGMRGQTTTVSVPLIGGRLL